MTQAKNIILDSRSQLLTSFWPMCQGNRPLKQDELRWPRRIHQWHGSDGHDEVRLGLRLFPRRVRALSQPLRRCSSLIHVPEC